MTRYPLRWARAVRPTFIGPLERADLRGPSPHLDGWDL